MRLLSLKKVFGLKESFFEITFIHEEPNNMNRRSDIQGLNIIYRNFLELDKSRTTCRGSKNDSSRLSTCSQVAFIRAVTSVSGWLLNELPPFSVTFFKYYNVQVIMSN